MTVGWTPDDNDLVDELGTVILKTTASGRTRIDHHSGKHDDQAIAVALAANWLMAQLFWGAPTVTDGADLQRAPRIKRDRRTLPRGTARDVVSRELAARVRLARLVRRR